MKFAKISFGLAIGWYTGRAVVHTVIGATNEFVRRCLPEKYWNSNHPDYIGNSVRKNDLTNRAKMKIGFHTD